MIRRGTARTLSGVALLAGTGLVPTLAQAQDLTAQLAEKTPVVVVADTTQGLSGALQSARYQANQTRHSGVVQLLGTNSATAGGFCSGSLLWTGRHILTAAHCVTTGTTLTRPTAFSRFRQAGLGQFDNTQDVIINGSVTVKPGWSGTVGVDKDDLAIITLDSEAPSWAARYNVFTGNPMDREMEIVGWGTKGNGNTGDLRDFSAASRLRGLNRVEAAYRSDEGNTLSRTADVGVTLYDFDNGSANRNTMCGFFAATCGDVGFGLDEVALGRGDSGGGAFIDGQIAGVASWVTAGFTSGGAACASATGISCFGALGGHAFAGEASNFAWIQSTVVPEPSTYALMLTGLVGIGVAARRRRQR